MSPSKPFPLAPWLLLVDALATILLAAGLMMVFSPESLAGFAPTPAMGWALVVSCGAAMLAATAAIALHVRARRT